MYHKFYPAVALGVALAFSLSGCSSTSSPTTSSPPTPTPSQTTTQAPNLAGTSWDLTTYETPKGTVKLIAPGWLDFDRNGKITGSAGCNKFTGSYTRDGWNLTLKVETSTRMPCPSGLSAQEAAIFASFDAVTSFKNGSTNLNLLNASGKEALTYKASDTPLVGTKWQATALNTGAGSVTALPSKPLVTATFDASGAIGGIGGCNSYGGSYTTGPGTKMTILKLTSTMMACMNGVDEAGYFGALEKTTNYVLSHGTLTLKDATGATLVQYVPVAR